MLPRMADKELAQICWEGYQATGTNTGDKRKTSACYPVNQTPQLQETDSVTQTTLNPSVFVDLGNQLASQAEAETEYADTANTTPYIGKAGARRNKGAVLNALDAVSRAGANPLGIATGNSNDVRLVSKYYNANPAVANQYDLATNLFLRYLSGVGTRDLQVVKEQGADIYRAFKDAKQRGAERKNGQVAVRYMPTGAIGPAGGLGVAGNEIKNSLGSFWAREMPDRSVVISERYNFDYAPKGKEGHGQKIPLLGVSPDQVGRNLVQAGYGKPFTYQLRVYPDGRVQVLPPANR